MSLDWDRARRSREMARVAARGMTWWIVFARKGSNCHDCGKATYGRPVAFNHDSGLAYCEACWERFGLSPKPSRNYLKGLRSTTTAQPSKGRKARRRRQRAGSQPQQ